MSSETRQYLEHLGTSPTIGTESPVRWYCCLCCQLPTLTEPSAYEICVICGWEDDGSLDGFGPNGTSLEEAQRNFNQYLTAYGPQHTYSPHFQAPGRIFIHDQELAPANLERKRQWIGGFKRYMAEPDIGLRSRIAQGIFPLSQSS